MPEPTAHTRRGAVVIAGFGLALSIAAACTGDSLSPDPCTGPATIISPASVTFSVGDTILADIELVGPPQCRPITMTRRQIRWRTDDTSVARVSPNKGYVVAKGVGQTQVIAYLPSDESIWGTIPVTVVP